MRPYRGLTKDGKWVYGNYCNLAGLSYIATYPVGAGISEGKKSIGGWIEVIPSTVGQQVGLKDKNGKGKDAYENDIALCSYGIGKQRFYMKGIIKWDSPKFYLAGFWEKLDSYGKSEGHEDSYAIGSNNRGLEIDSIVEIIGTIHDKEQA